MSVAPLSPFVREVRGCFSPKGRLASALGDFVSRPSQVEYAETVAQALEEKKSVVLEAGTGTGKTFAYLVPTLLAGRKAIVSTAGKTLQAQLFEKDIPALQAALGVRIDAKLLKGRSNYICLKRLYQVRQTGLPSREAFEDLARIEAFAKSDAGGDKAHVTGVAEDAIIWPYVTSTKENCLGGKCPYASDCFVNRARAAAKEAELVVVNHHLLLSALAVRDESETEMLPASDIIIVDEAHKLTEIATDFFGQELSSWYIKEQVKEAKRITMSRHRSVHPKDQSWDALCDAVTYAMQDFVLKLEALGVLEGDCRDLAQIGDAEQAAPVLALCGEHLRSLVEALKTLAEADENLEKLQGLLSLELTEIERWRECLLNAKASVTNADGIVQVRWIERTATEARLHETPISFALDFERMRDALGDISWVFTSATLATGAGDFSHFVKELGLEQAETRAWASPFDYTNQALLYVPVAMPLPRISEREHFIEQLVEESWPLIDMLEGKTLFLCTSRQAMLLTCEALRNRIDANKRDYEVLVQNEDTRVRLLEKFRRDNHTILVATMSFWEGIDIKGEALSLVVIDKLPFAPKGDPVLEAQCRWIDDQGGNAFFEHQIPLAAIALKQGAGRLIRSETDRGILLIGDRRIIQGEGSRYGERFLSSLPAFSRTRRLERVIDFWQHPDDWR